MNIIADTMPATGAGAAQAGAGPKPAGYSDTPTVLRYWMAIKKHRLGILAILALATALAILATFLMTPYYTAVSRIEISRANDNVTNVEGLRPQNENNDQEFYATQYSLLEAETIAQRVARARNLANNDAFFEAFGVDLSDSTGLQQKSKNLSGAERSGRMALATSILLDHVSISPVRGSSLVDVKFSSPDPSLSATIANTWVSEYVASMLERRFASTADARKFLEDKLEQMRQRLEESERQQVQYADRNGIITLQTSQDGEGRTTSQATLASANLQALNNELASATAERISAESVARNSSKADKDSLQNPAINGLRQKRAELAADYAKMMVQFEPGYPPAKAIASQIAVLDKSIAAEEARFGASAQSRYAQAMQRERQLQDKVSQLKGQLLGERQNSIQYNIYQREVDTNRQLYDSLLQRYKEIGVAGVGSNNISVVDPAQVPTSPSSPNLPLNIALALIAGLGLAGLYVFVAEQIDQTVSNPDDIQHRLGLSTLGVVPTINPEEFEKSTSDKKSVLWEAYQALRTNMSFLTDHGVPRSFQVTSTRPNEGKSTSAYMLGKVLAANGKTVLIIDSDMRNPSMHKIFETHNNAGLSNFLAGEDNLNTLVQPTADAGVSLMPAGPIPPNPAELLSNNRLPELIELLKGRYNYVVIDSPPVLGLADAPLISRAVEGVVYTIEANGAKIKGIESALQRLQMARATIFGAILSKHDNKNAQYGYGYGYEYEYGER